MAPKGDTLAQEWQLECEGLRQRAGIVLRTEQWTDCSFLVGSQGWEVKAHKLMLAMASPVFEAMFYGGLAEVGHAIRVPDIEPNVFNAMLEFIYTDNYEINSDIMAIDVYYAAQKYMLPKLQKHCSSYLSSSLTPEIICRVYEFSLMVAETGLSGDCKTIILSKTEDALKSKCFLDLNIDTVVEIFSWNELEISSELVLIQAAHRYNQALKARSRDAGHKATAQPIMNRQEGGDTEHYSLSASGESVDDGNSVNAEAGDMGHGDQIKRENGDSDDIKWLLELEIENVETKKKREAVADREMLRVLRQIRFLSLTPKQIAEEKSLLSLLTRYEMLAVLVNAEADKAVLPMPNGFSTNKNKRYIRKVVEEKYCSSCGHKTAHSTWEKKTYNYGDTACIFRLVCPVCKRCDYDI